MTEREQGIDPSLFATWISEPEIGPIDEVEEPEAATGSTSIFRSEPEPMKIVTLEDLGESIPEEEKPTTATPKVIPPRPSSRAMVPVPVEIPAEEQDHPWRKRIFVAGVTIASLAGTAHLLGIDTPMLDAMRSDTPAADSSSPTPPTTEAGKPPAERAAAPPESKPNTPSTTEAPKPEQKPLVLTELARQQMVRRYGRIDALRPLYEKISQETGVPAAFLAGIDSVESDNYDNLSMVRGEKIGTPNTYDSIVYGNTKEENVRMAAHRLIANTGQYYPNVKITKDMNTTDMGWAALAYHYGGRYGAAKWHFSKSPYVVGQLDGFINAKFPTEGFYDFACKDKCEPNNNWGEAGGPEGIQGLEFKRPGVLAATMAIAEHWHPPAAPPAPAPSPNTTSQPPTMRLLEDEPTTTTQPPSDPPTMRRLD